MSSLRFTLVSEGPSDRALLPVLRWMVSEHVFQEIQPQWPEYYPFERPASLSERIELALELYPCDVVFIHRDADRSPREKRVDEIRAAIAECQNAAQVPVVCVIPVRMTETWLLIDEAALRAAAGNPQGRQPLDMPRLRDLESLSDPKTALHNLIRDASGLSGRRLKRLGMSFSVARVAELIDDFSPLRHLQAFEAMEKEFLALK